jgi:hypothetical protein
MGTIQPEGKNVSKAIKWISENLKEDKTLLPKTLIEEAGARFNLSPKDEEFLMSFYK